MQAEPRGHFARSSFFFFPFPCDKARGGEKNRSALFPSLPSSLSLCRYGTPFIFTIGEHFLDMSPARRKTATPPPSPLCANDRALCALSPSSLLAAPPKKWAVYGACGTAWMVRQPDHGNIQQGPPTGVGLLLEKFVKPQTTPKLDSFCQKGF